MRNEHPTTALAPNGKRNRDPGDCEHREDGKAALRSQAW